MYFRELNNARNKLDAFHLLFFFERAVVFIIYWIPMGALMKTYQRVAARREVNSSRPL